MRKLFLPAVACTLWLLMFTGSAAASITYTVDATIPGGSVTGTITTNGMLGTITGFGTTTDPFFQAYDLVLTTGGQSTTIMGNASLANSGPFGAGLVFGSLTATDTQLDWNFDGSNSFLNFQPSLFGTGQCFVLRNTANLGFADCGIGMSNILANGITTAVDTSTFLSSAVSGPFVLGTAVPEVPEPATVWLTLAGFGLVSVIGLRKRHVSSCG